MSVGESDIGFWDSSAVDCIYIYIYMLVCMLIGCCKSVCRLPPTVVAGCSIAAGLMELVVERQMVVKF